MVVNLLKLLMNSALMVREFGFVSSPKILQQCYLQLYYDVVKMTHVHLILANGMNVENVYPLITNHPRIATCSSLIHISSYIVIGAVRL